MKHSDPSFYSGFLCTRQLVGEEISKTRDAELIARTYKKAIKRYPEAKPRIFHSDRGIEYANYKIGNMLESKSIRQSMSGKDNCYDNAHMESFFHNPKAERIHGNEYGNDETLRGVITEDIGFYNNRCLHSSIDYLTPAEYESRIN